MTQRLVLLTLILACVALPAWAQEGTPKAEVFGGFSMISPGDSGLYGWQASVAGNLTRTIGLVGDIGGYYRTVNAFGSSIHAHAYSFLGGPRFNYRRENVTVFVHELVGVTNVGGSVSNVGGGSINGFQMAFGGGLDVKAGERLKIRVIQADLLTSRLLDQWGSDIRLGFGVVLPFGR